MNLPQAIEQATALTFPAFLTDDNQRNAERLKNEEAIRLLTDAWMQAPQGLEPFDFSLVRGLADRNRELCDLIEDTSFQNQRGLSLAQRLTDADRDIDTAGEVPVDLNGIKNGQDKKRDPCILGSFQ